MFGRRKDQDFSDELRSHLELEADRLRSEGLSQREAYAAARRAMGNVTAAEERFYESRRTIWLDHLRQDVRLALRQWNRSKGFTAIAALTLALGIGANTAIFTLIYEAMVKPLPVANPESLVRLGDGAQCCVIGGFQRRYSIYSNELFRHIRANTPEFERLAAFDAQLERISVRRKGAAATLDGFIREYVSGDYFLTFGVRPFAGRLLAPEDDRASAPPVAVLSYRAWENAFGRDPSIVGSTLIAQGVPVTVAGIAAPGFFGETLRPDPPELWLPLSVEALVNGASGLLNQKDTSWLYAIGRLRPGADPRAMEPRLDALLQNWIVANYGDELTPDIRKKIADEHIHLAPAAAGVAQMKRRYGEGLRLLMALSGLTLLLACANLAGMLLARATATRVQTSIRIALGASRARLFRHLLTESVMLSLLGGALGIAVAYGATRVILVLAFRGARFVPIDADPSLAVLGFTLLLSVLTGILFGAAPAWSASRSDPADALRGANRSTRGRSTGYQRWLVAAQAALSLVLLTGAGLLTQTLRNLEGQSFGFQTPGRVMVKVGARLAGYPPEKIAGVYQRLDEGLRRIPGVASASYALYSPMEEENWSQSVYVEGRPKAKNYDDQDNSSWDRVSAHYFETIGTRLLRGRFIDERDTPASRFVAVVNQAFANQFFKDQDPIGKHLGFSDKGRYEFEVVGVVEDAKYMAANEPAWPTFFVPFLQVQPDEWKFPGQARSNSLGGVQLRTSVPVSAIEPQIRSAISEADDGLSVLEIKTFSEQVARNFNQERLLARLTGLFGLLSLTLASVGLYAVTSYAAARRTSEIGIRIALGAKRSRVMADMVRGALAQIAIGLLVGIPAALACGRLLRNQLYGVSAWDPVALAGAAAALLVCAAVAAFVPARRASGVDPIQALRIE